MGGSSPKVQAPVVQPIVKKQDPAVQNAVAEAVRNRARGRGFRSTILSRDFLDPQNARLQETLGS